MHIGHGFSKGLWGLVGLCLLGLSACQLSAKPTPVLTSEPPPSSQARTVAPSQTPSPIMSGAIPPSPTPEIAKPSAAANELAASPTPTPVFYEPAGCWQPPDDYTRVEINKHTLNARTIAMLQQAAMLYKGAVDVAGSAIIQGSYISSDPLGTHLGGGVVDLSVTAPNSSAVLYTDIEPLIQALRVVGFAAWLMNDETFESELGLHIHAIAIADNELSPTAQEQLTGPAGYFLGYNGLSIVGTEPVLDRYGGPLVCRWMHEAGYSDLRSSTSHSTPAIAWQERLRQSALSYVAPFPEDAEAVARKLDFLEGPGESATNVCGPLAAAILRDAGLLPNQPGPVQDLLSYWQARPIGNGRPWNLFSERDYEVFRFDTPLQEFDFTAWPLEPADFVYTYAKDSGFEHMFIVTEVDSEGRAYTVTNQKQSWGNKLWGTMLIMRYMLYDPQVPGEGIIYNEWSDPHLGRTGYNGFEVLRKRGLEAGSLYAYSVRPGDTLPDLAARFEATSESIVQANPGLDMANLLVDQVITIPIPANPLDFNQNVEGRLP